MLKGLKVNVTDATFETGDKTAMFEFSHPATEQTPALTDYRYIGHMPNNYVKFNCDNDGTDCEIWRIIGVFSVDDGEGNYEQRIKLVIGSAFAETMQWDDREAEGYEKGNGYGKNDWNGAKLNIFLNGDYLTRHGDSSSYGLKELAQSQIEDAKYYLGGRSYDSNTDYGSTNDMYAWERGTETFSYEYYCSLSWNSSNSKCASNYCENNPSDEICNATRSISWIGKIALMYSSDYGYTYSNGVEDECFNNPHMCYYSEGSCPTCGNGNYNYPETGWIHNSNNGFTNWLLPPCLNSSAFVFSVSGSGNDHAYAYDTIWVRPVLYLKSSINITGGEGTEQNPYILSNQ